MTGKIVVIGSSNVDLIMQVERLPKPGETIIGGVFNQTYGGKGANQAVGAARAGANVSFISCLGDDGFAPDFISNFEKDGIDTHFIWKEPGMSTGTALIMIDAVGENCITVAPGANYALNPVHIDQAAELIKAADLVLMQCEIHPDTIHYIIDKAHSLGRKIVLNLAPAYPLEKQYLEKLDILIVNESEAALLSGLPVSSTAEAEKALSVLEKIVNGKVILTLGAKGSLLADNGQQHFIPAFKVKAVDTTAAGDIYCGSLAAALVEGHSINDAIKFASAAAAISVGRLGAQASAPTKTEIETLLQ